MPPQSSTLDFVSPCARIRSTSLYMVNVLITCGSRAGGQNVDVARSSRRRAAGCRRRRSRRLGHSRTQVIEQQAGGLCGVRQQVAARALLPLGQAL